MCSSTLGIGGECECASWFMCFAQHHDYLRVSGTTTTVVVCVVRTKKTRVWMDLLVTYLRRNQYVLWREVNHKRNPTLPKTGDIQKRRKPMMIDDMVTAQDDR